MFNPIRFVKVWWSNRKVMDMQQFAHNHRKFLVVICDPADDTMFVSYKDKQIRGSIKSVDGFNHEVVKRVLKHSTFRSAIDRFLGGIIDVLKLDIENGSDFYKFLDGALFNISKALTKVKSYVTASR